MSNQIAELLGVDSQEIFFTSGGTEGDNWILKGVAFEKRPYGNHIIVSNVEHPAVKNTAEWLKTQGFEVDLAPVVAHEIYEQIKPRNLPALSTKPLMEFYQWPVLHLHEKKLLAYLLMVITSLFLM